ncbi:MAG: hypothetical protein R8K49_07940 [Mariprofundaceae bacterium]
MHKLKAIHNYKTIQHNSQIVVTVQITAYFYQWQGEKAQLTPVSHSGYPTSHPQGKPWLVQTAPALL